MTIGIADPGDFGVDVHRRVNRFAIRVSNDHAALFGDERGADVVRMAGKCWRKAACGEHWPHQRPEIGNEAVVAGNQLIELTAGRRVLVLEAVRLSRRIRTKRAEYDRLVDRRQFITRPGEEPGDGRVAVLDGRGRGGAQLNRNRLVRQTVEAACDCATAWYSRPLRFTIRRWVG